MSEQKATRAHRSQTVVSAATVYNGDTFGLVLGDLRKLITAAEGIPDDAEVTIEDVSAHYSRKDTYLAKRVRVSHSAKSSDAP